jgi:hypothetical protein
VDQQDEASTRPAADHRAQDEHDDRSYDEPQDELGEAADQPEQEPGDGPPEDAAQVEQAPSRWRTGAGRLQERIRAHYESQRYSFVPAVENVVIDARQHPLVLVTPVVRTFAGLALLLVGPLLLPLAWFALVTAVWAWIRLGGGLRQSAIVAGVAAGTFVVLHALEGRRWDAVLLVLLLLWLVEDVLDWHSDRLVVTDKRIYRRHGVITRHSPSISLMAIAYIDSAVPPLGRLLHYGTLRLDSVAQRDDPLSRFDLIPDVVPVSHEILRLRAAAMPKGPPQAI